MDEHSNNSKQLKKRKFLVEMEGGKRKREGGKEREEESREMKVQRG